MPPAFLTIDPRTSPISLSPLPSPNISPQLDVDRLGVRQSDDGPVSPLTPNDFSRLSGFPQLLNFDFAFDDNRSSLGGPPSPSGPRRPLNNASVEDSVPRVSGVEDSSAAVPQRPSIAVPPNAAPGRVHRPTGAVEDAEAPPPYSRYGAQSTIWGAQNMPPAVPIAMFTHGNPRFTVTAGAPVIVNPRSQSGQRGLHVHALADMQSQCGKFVKQDTWREKITGGYWETEVETGTGSKRLTRKGKCIFAVAGVIILVTIIVSVVVGVLTTRRNRGRFKDHVPNQGDTQPWFPKLPEGTHVLKAQGRPVMRACVSLSSLWSCELPSDSLFPKTILPSNESVLPEFRFTIHDANKTNSNSRTFWRPIPEKTPNETDYSNLAETDGVQAYPKFGVASSYYISMVTQDPSSQRSEEDRSTPAAGSVPSFSSKPPRMLRFRRRDPPASTKNMFPEAIENQPLRFFDQGLDTEHYGFFMYFTKTIRVSSVTETTEDPEGGLPSSVESGTDVRWERTRFKVTIWTKKRLVGKVELIDPQGHSLQSTVDDGLPFAVSIVEDRYGDRGPITYGPDLTEIPEKFGKDEKCFCEWRNWRTKV